MRRTTYPGVMSASASSHRGDGSGRVEFGYGVWIYTGNIYKLGSSIDGWVGGTELKHKSAPGFDVVGYSHGLKAAVG